MSSKCALIMAGGTGGHIFPGLAVADALRERGWRVHWLGAPASMEARLVPAQGFALETISFGGVRGKSVLTLALLPFDAGERMDDDLRNMVWRGHYLGYGPADVMLHVPVDKYLMQENRQTFIFAPYMRQVQVLLHDTRMLPQVTGPDDLKGHKLAVERGTGMGSVLMGQQNGMLRSQVSVYSSGVEAAQAVINGQAAAAYVLRSQAEAALALAQPRPTHLAMTSLPLHGIPENGWPLGVAIKAVNKDLGQAIEAAFKELRSNGELLAMFHKRGMTLTAP